MGNSHYLWGCHSCFIISITLSRRGRTQRNAISVKSEGQILSAYTFHVQNTLAHDHVDKVTYTRAHAQVEQRWQSHGRLQMRLQQQQHLRLQVLWLLSKASARALMRPPWSLPPLLLILLHILHLHLLLLLLTLLLFLQLIRHHLHKRGLKISPPHSSPLVLR